MYIVISNPKRMSIAAGVVQVIFYPLSLDLQYTLHTVFKKV